MSKMVKLKNCSNQTYKFEIASLPGQPPTKYEVAPGECCEVAAGYCQSTNGRPSMIERRAPGLKRVEDCPPEPPPAPAEAKPQPSPAAPAPSSAELFSEPLRVEEKPKKKWAKARKKKADK